MNIITVTNRKWWVVATVSIAICLAGIDLTVVNLALVSIAKSLDTTLDTLQWLVSGFLLVWAIFSVMGGRLSDKFGRRRIFIFGVTLFMLASLLAGITANISMLIIARVIQGFSIALFFPACFAMTFNAFPPQQRGRGISAIATVAGIGSALGPTLGGFLLHLYGWRAVFLINIPFCLFSIMLAYMVIDKIHDDIIGHQTFDIPGAFLLAIGVFGIIFTINKLGAPGDHALWMVVLVLSVLALFVFYKVERHTQHPLIPFETFLNKTFVSVNILRVFVQYMLIATVMLLPLLMQNVLAFSVIKSGLVMMSISIVFGLLSPWGGWMYDVFGARRPIVIAFILSALAFYLLSYVNQSSSLLYFISAQLMFGAAIGIIYPCLSTTGIQAVPSSDSSTGAGVIFMSTMFGGALAAVISAMMLIIQGGNRLLQLLQQQHISLPRNTLYTVKHLLSHASFSIHDVSYFDTVTAQHVIAMAQQAFVAVYANIMLLAMILSLLAAVIGFFCLPDKRD